jgi:cytochrome P450
VSAPALPAVDLTSHDTFVEGVQHDFFAAKRRDEPVFRHPERDGPGFWCVTRHDDLVAVHRDPRTFSSELGQVRMEDLRPDEIEARKSMLETDPPRHSRLRRIVSAEFTPRAVAEYEGYARTLAREVLDRALRDSELDFVEAIAAPFPINVLVRILGAPPEDAPRLIDLGNRMIAKEDPEYAGSEADGDRSAYRLLPFGSRAAVELIEYGDWLAAKRRERAENDLVSKLVHAEIDGERLTPAEFANFFALLVIAGNETTRQAISHGILALLENEAELRTLAADPSLAAVATEEILRWATPVFYFRRTATRDTEIRGVPIAAGDKIVLWYISANFDEAVFDYPYRFDIRREPNDHVTFGKAGPHYCLGAYLARLEIRVMFEELLPRLRAIELAGPVARVRSNFINGIKHMPVRLEGA